MDTEKLIQIYNTLNQLEVKGYENVNKLFGVMFAIRQEIEGNADTAEQQ